MIINRKSAEALELRKRAELRALDEREALAASDRLLAMAATASYPPGKERSAGLIARQKILYPTKQ